MFWHFDRLKLGFCVTGVQIADFVLFLHWAKIWVRYVPKPGRVEGRRVGSPTWIKWRPERWRAQNFALFVFPLPPSNFGFLSLSVSSRGIVAAVQSVRSGFTGVIFAGAPHVLEPRPQFHVKWRKN